MKPLIIGATGYIGSHIGEAFVQAGHQAAALQRPGGRPVPDAYRPVPGDLLDPPTLTRAASSFDLVIHAGPPLGDADLYGVDALIAAGVPVLYTTGAAVLGGGPADEDSPPDPHPIAALRPEIERRVVAAGGWVIRPGMVYGNGGGLVHDLFTRKAAECGTGVYIGPAGVRWPVVHVDDLAALYVAVAERAPRGTIWHGIAETVRLDAIAAAVGGGTAISWPLRQAEAELGLLADLFTRDQDVSAAKTRQRLKWDPVHTSMVAALRSGPS